MPSASDPGGQTLPPPSVRLRGLPLLLAPLSHAMRPPPQALIAYISVKSERFPVAPGFARGKCLAPSYHLATTLTGGGLRLRRLSHSVVGGWVPSLFDAIAKPTALAPAAEEALRFRDALVPEDADHTKSVIGGGASLVEWARDVQWDLDRERELEASPLKERPSALAYSPELWVREHTPANAPPPPPGAKGDPVHATNHAVGPDALELGWAKKYGPSLKNKGRNKFALMHSEKETKASEKMQNVGHNGTDSWEMEAAIRAKAFTQGAKQTRYGGPFTGVKATVTKDDLMISEHLKYQTHVKDVKTPDKSLYQGVAAKIPVDAYLIEDQRNVKAIIRANKVEGDQNTSMPAPRYGPDSFLAEAYRKATGLVTAAQTGIEEATIVRSASPGVKSKLALSGLGRTLFSSARPVPEDGPLHAPEGPSPQTPERQAATPSDGPLYASPDPSASPPQLSAADAEMSA